MSELCPLSALVWFYIGMAGAFCFILIQLVLLIDFAHSWNESWVEKMEEGNSRCWYAGMSCSFLQKRFMHAQNQLPWRPGSWEVLKALEKSTGAMKVKTSSCFLDMMSVSGPNEKAWFWRQSSRIQSEPARWGQEG